MDDPRLGRRIRALRHRLRWRQVDLARRAGVSQDRVSRVERGHIARTPIAELQAVAAALDAELAIELRWRGAALDRLVDEGHAQLVGDTARALTSATWLVRAEVSYSIYGERGSIDLLAWHAQTGSLLVVEVKTELVSLEETLRRHDTKVRLARQIATGRFGWRVDRVGRLLVLPATSTARRQVARHGSVIDAAYRLHGSAVRRWIRHPSTAEGGVLFLPVSRPGAPAARCHRMRSPTATVDPGRPTARRTAAD